MQQIATHTRKAEAAACTSATATVTQTSSPIFYIDDPTYNHSYVSYSVTTGSSKTYTDLWVKVDTFTNTSLLGLAATEDGLYHVGAMSSSSTANVYFFLKGATTASAQSYTLHLYEGKPSNGGIESCSSAQSNSSVSSTIEANNNSVTSVTYGAPYIGSTFTMTVIGDTGTIGSAGLFNYTPATQSTWNADCLELKGTSITMSGGNTGTFTNGLYRSGLASSTTHYTITYTFTAKCVTASTTPVVPMSYISSGAQVKHTSVSNYGTLPPIAPATNSLVMTKSVSPAASTSGGTATYSVNITNNGPSSSTLDDITDVLPSSPATVSYQSGTSTYDTDIDDASAATSISNPSSSGQTMTWVRTFTIPSGKTAQLQYQVTIPSTVGSYVNSAVAHSGTAQIDKTASTTDNVPATATYGVGSINMAASTKTAEDINGGSLQPGDIIQYTISAINSGTSDATGVHISDTIDTNTNNLTSVVIGANGTDCGSSYSNNTTSTALDITNASVPHGTHCDVTFRATVKSATTDGTTILNSASIVPSNAGSISGNPSSDPMIVRKTPILSVTNTENDADNVVVANQVVTYTITITNSGQASASGVDLTGTIGGPVGSISSRTLTNCGPSTTYVDTSSGTSLNIAALSITTSNPCVISYTVTVNADATSGSVTNSVDITAAREGGNNPDAVSASTLLIGAVATPPSLSPTITENDTDNYVFPGQSVTYTITVQNSGQTDASTSLTSTIPVGMGTPGSITYTNCGSASSSYSSRVLTITLIDVPAANTCTITFAVTVNTPLDEGTTLTVSADVAQASQGGNDPASINATTLTVDATPMLAITTAENDADNVVNPGQEITYTTTITNSGDGSATGVPLTDTFTGSVGSPSNFTLTNCGSSYTNSSTTSVNITGLSISTTASCVVTYRVTVDSNAAGGSTVTNLANITGANEGGNNPIPVSASTLTVATSPTLGVTVADNDADDVVTPGQTIQFTITIANTGGLNATTTAAVSIPSGTASPSSISFTNCGSAGSSYSAPTLSLSSLTITTSASCVIRFNLVVSSPNTEGRTLVVGADVAAASEGGNNPANVNSSTLTIDVTPVLSTSTFALTDANGGTLAPGENITYTWTIINTGDGAATGITLSSAINANVTFNTGTLNYSNCGSPGSASTSSNLSLTSLSVSVGTNCVITATGALASPLNEGTSISGTATVGAASEGGSGSSLTSNTLTVDATPSLVVTSSSDATSPVQPGQDITYTITIANNGNGQATGISLSDPISGSVGSISSLSLDGCGSTYTNGTSGSTLSLSGIKISASATCTITFHIVVSGTATGGSSVSDSADASAATEGGNNPAAVSAGTYTVATVPNLSVSFTDNDADNTVTPGQNIQFTLTITNSGNGTGTTSAIVSIPSAVGSPSSISYSNCGSASSSFSRPSLTLSSLSVTTSAACVITFTTQVSSPGSEGATFKLAADVAAASQGGNNPDSIDSTTFTVDTTPNISTSTMVASDDNGGTLKPGDAVTYTITVKNTGDGVANGVNLDTSVSLNADLDPGSVQFTNCGSSYIDLSDTDIVIAGLQIQVGIDCVITYQTVVRSPMDDGTPISGSATLSVPDEGGSSAEITANTLNVDATPNISLNLESNYADPTITPGTTVHYTLTLTNTGDGIGTTDATVAIPSGYEAPTNITFHHCTSTTSNYAAPTLTLSSLRVDTAVACTVEFDVMVSSPNIENRNLAVTADAPTAAEGGNNPDPVMSSDIHVDVTPQLSTAIASDDEDNIVSLGQTVNTQITITNTGDGLATGVGAVYELQGPGEAITGISTADCGASSSHNLSDSTLTFTGLKVSVGTPCVISLAFDVSASAAADSVIDQAVDVSAAAEGGNNPDAASADQLSVDVTNQAPNVPADVTSTKLIGHQMLGPGALVGTSLSASLSDPNADDQVRYRIQISLNPGFFTDVAIDYRSAYGAQGSKTYTYQEDTGTYLIGNSSTNLADGTYYIRVRAEDEHGATSAWYTVAGTAFTYDTTAPNTPPAPYLVGSIIDDTATIGWDAATDPNPDPTIPYRLQASPNADFSDAIEADTADLSKFFSGLPKGAHYYFRLAVRDAAGNISDFSETLDIYIPADTPAPEPEPQPEPGPTTNNQATKVVTTAPTKTITLYEAVAYGTSGQGIDVSEQTDSGEGITVIISVLDQNNDPVPNAKVTLHSNPRTGYTNKEGSITFKGVSIGNHTVIVEYQGQKITKPLAVTKSVNEVHLDLKLTTKERCCWWCWIPWLLLLIIIWRYHRYRVKKKREHQEKR